MTMERMTDKMSELSICCDHLPLGELSDEGFGRCGDCFEMSEFEVFND